MRAGRRGEPSEEAFRWRRPQGQLLHRGSEAQGSKEGARVVSVLLEFHRRLVELVARSLW